MDRGKMGGKLLLVVASLAVSAFVVEISFWLVSRAEPIYPAVYYETDEPGLSLACYDDHFASTPDWVCGGKLTYWGNANVDPALANLSPRKVPNAIEIRKNGTGLRERPTAAFDARRDKIVVVVGDSFCFGQGVRVSDRFSNVLETRLNREHPAEHYRLFAGCKTGWNIERIARRMEGYIKHFGRVDRVVYSFVLNDPIKKGCLEEREIELGLHLRPSLLVPRRRSARPIFGGTGQLYPALVCPALAAAADRP